MTTPNDTTGTRDKWDKLAENQFDGLMFTSSADRKLATDRVAAQLREAYRLGTDFGWKKAMKDAGWTREP